MMDYDHSPRRQWSVLIVGALEPLVVVVLLLDYYGEGLRLRANKKLNILLGLRRASL